MGSIGYQRLAGGWRKPANGVKNGRRNLRDDGARCAQARPLRGAERPDGGHPAPCAEY